MLWVRPLSLSEKLKRVIEMDNIGNSGCLLNLSTLKYMVQNTALSRVFSEELHILARINKTPTLAAHSSSIIKTNRQEAKHNERAFRCLFYPHHINHNIGDFVCLHVYYRVAMGWSFICLDWALMVTSVLLSVMMLPRPPPSPSPWANPPPLLLSLALFQSLHLSLSLSLSPPSPQHQTAWSPRPAGEGLTVMK